MSRYKEVKEACGAVNFEDADPSLEATQGLDAERRLHCRACHQALSRETDLVVITGGTSRHKFVNPAGVMHELITVTDVQGVEQHGERTLAFSWFPGWSWQFTSCGSCHAFLGWCFEATSADRLPPKFHGLRIQAVILA
jgi:hypothetical protein